jgi:hypothetical protein
MYTYTVPFGKDELHFDLPHGMTGAIATSRPANPLADLKGAIERDFAGPA